ncbi:hypothetical protein K1719_024738 [Acacia pycnantha]|nr:hypothetical protein K1719_024738 [Acacia pycnantha]
MAKVLWRAGPPVTSLYSQLQRVNGVKCCSTKRTNYAALNPQTPPPLRIAVSAVTELLRLFSPTSVTEEQPDESPVSSVDDVLNIIQSDYVNAYFVTGISRLLYTLKIASLKIQLLAFGVGVIEKVVAADTNFITATWKLRTELKLPWRPLICIDGSTLYELDENFKIVKHAESWDVSALEAIGQIFNFNSRNYVG